MQTRTLRYQTKKFSFATLCVLFPSSSKQARRHTYALIGRTNKQTNKRRQTGTYSTYSTSRKNAAYDMLCIPYCVPFVSCPWLNRLTRLDSLNHHYTAATVVVAVGRSRQLFCSILFCSHKNKKSSTVHALYCLYCTVHKIISTGVSCAMNEWTAALKPHC